MPPTDSKVYKGSAQKKAGLHENGQVTEAKRSLKHCYYNTIMWVYKLDHFVTSVKLQSKNNCWRLKQITSSTVTKITDTHHTTEGRRCRRVRVRVDVSGLSRGRTELNGMKSGGEVRRHSISVPLELYSRPQIYFLVAQFGYTAAIIN